MDVCAYCDKSASGNVSHTCLSPGSHSGCEHYNSALDSGLDGDLRNRLSDLVIILEDQQLCNSKFSKDDIQSTPDNFSDRLSSKKCLVKFATFPSSTKSSSPNELIHQRQMEQMNDVTAEPLAPNGEASSAPLSTPSKSLPSATKLLSALKGSREKQGIVPHKKLHVSWAPDVYDPPVPIPISNVSINRHQRHRSDGKKNGKKNKQQSSGKSSRANKGKDKKKHGRKYGGTCERGFYHLEDHNVVISSRELPTIGLDIASPDQLCGSSYLYSSVSKLHFPLAEAT
ncbi:unnamed protein product [Cuscuta epithymum]|uniref:Uncharacterized protein n=1 Tax=Cuscuta epithymum TaxID=186058 RepID=A0AAV0GDE0_9ASTE|nr:unnamed protein product [Cuscuta epithymum]CAH9145368.1 unnamed protein product [Cuscuta epithymum]